MATMVGTQKELTSVLSALLELEYDAIEAYRAAVGRVANIADRDQFASFLEDHERHIRELVPLIEALGEKAPTGPDIKQVLTKGKVVIAGLVGDRAVFMAMKTNEDDTNRAYDRVTSRTDLPMAMREVIERNFADERRHRAWIEQRLASPQISATR